MSNPSLRFFYKKGTFHIMPNLVYTLNGEEFAVLRTVLEEQNFLLEEAPYMHFKASKEKNSLCAYLSGKLVIQGKGADEIREFILEPLVLKEKAFKEAETEEVFTPHAGMDESGKGDFFGPLVVAAVYVPDRESAEKLKEYGVRDSKLIKSDKAILETASRIRTLLKDQMGMVTIGPEAYNRIYHSFGSLNRLLAWGHARALENLLQNVPECPRALADKFGDENLILRALNERGRKIQLDQRTKAESDIAVAAASIMARAQFVRSMEKLGETSGIKLPKGAGIQVDECALLLFEKGGTQLLEKVAKMHFKNARKAQGLPPLPATGFDYHKAK